ncbi:mechanosensitive ion channel family protein [Marivita geojedonensis]|uniref:Mechanosensitive ion channel protein MscS n=1 Tax=Marivita geojedonensis TaxID=1123756 RepID=A0A1X4NL53_9RHOB|nr:mechanosensitive ion channel domain-containing protein [Marivita geojedonensis]OSQ50974.1 mechanosensitive ion channel protein MscS [Marivita geojedonensis]PRY80034.1 mechanosensitive ion channel-like protein [Marivita geojedonensis]
MEWDLSEQPPIVRKAAEFALQGYEIALTWLVSPAAWSQFAILIVAYLAAVFVARRVRKPLTRVLTPPDDSSSIFTKPRLFLLLFIPLLMAVFAYAFAAIGEQVIRSVFGTGSVIAFGKRVFLLIAARIFVRDLVSDPFLKLLGKYVLLPAMALYAVGLLDVLTERLNETIIQLGNISFSVMALLRGVIAGAILFWLGRWSNDQSASYINRQEEMRPATRQLAAKAAELLIFGLAFILLMNIMGIPLTSLAVLGGAIGVGLGFGLQKIASNYISGVILLLEGQATVGDYVELDNGESGTIVRTTARAMILETFDGRWIVVPNEDFITTRVINYSDQGSANRLEVAFSVSYDTDINLVPDIIVEAVSKHPGVLQSPEPPDVELRGFGDSGIDFGVEFWVNGIDDGKNKYASDVLFLIWNALKAHNIEIPYPHRVIKMRNAPAVE